MSWFILQHKSPMSWVINNGPMGGLPKPQIIHLFIGFSITLPETNIAHFSWAMLVSGSVFSPSILGYPYFWFNTQILPFSSPFVCLFCIGTLLNSPCQILKNYRIHWGVKPLKTKTYHLKGVEASLLSHELTAKA